VHTPFTRIIWIVLDSVGIGELPDAADYGDVGRFAQPPPQSALLRQVIYSIFTAG
jgi:hypothetical protein